MSAAAVGSLAVPLAGLIAGLPRGVMPAGRRAVVPVNGVNGCAGAEGFFPAGLEGGLEFVAHPVRGVGVEAAHPGDLVPEPLVAISRA